MLACLFVFSCVWYVCVVCCVMVCACGFRFFCAAVVWYVVCVCLLILVCGFVFVAYRLLISVCLIVRLVVRLFGCLVALLRVFV